MTKVQTLLLQSHIWIRAVQSPSKRGSRNEKETRKEKKKNGNKKRKEKKNDQWKKEKNIKQEKERIRVEAIFYGEGVLNCSELHF